MTGSVGEHAPGQLCHGTERTTPDTVALCQKHNRRAQRGYLLGRERDRADGLDDPVLEIVHVRELVFELERVRVCCQTGNEGVPARWTRVPLQSVKAKVV